MTNGALYLCETHRGGGGAGGASPSILALARVGALRVD
eukprot:SAG11_NODE_9728_length_885_cov_1.376590_1_plen_37_part_10